MSLLKILNEFKLIIFSAFLIVVIILFMPEIEKPRCVDMIASKTIIC